MSESEVVFKSFEKKSKYKKKKSCEEVRKRKDLKEEKQKVVESVIATKIYKRNLICP